MNITLRNITKENYLAAIKLKVTPEQDNFVAPNVFSIAQSKFYTSWKPTAIFNEEEMVGFLMYGDYDLNEGDGTIWIIRLMVDVNFQKKGFGREAMLKLIDHIKNNYAQKELFVSFVPENISAKNLYESLGFKDTGRVDEDEIVYCLNFKKKM